MDRDDLLINTSYPLVLFDYAIQHNQIDLFYQQVKKIIADLTLNNQELANFLSNVNLSKDERKQTLNEIYSNKIDTYIIYFLYSIIDFNRSHCILKILNEFIKQVQKHLNIVSLTVFSAFQLNEKQMQKLCVCLQNKYQKEIELTNVVDPTLIGGIKVESDFDSVDLTIVNQLEQMKQISLDVLSGVKGKKDE